MINDKDKPIKVTGTREFETGAHRDPNDIKGRFDLLSPIFLRRLAIHTQKGGKARGDRNWEKGMPMSAVIDSAIRHLFDYLEGDRSEDHLSASAWNVMNLQHTEEMIKRGQLPAELNDLPDYTAPEAEEVGEPFESITKVHICSKHGSYKWPDTLTIEGAPIRSCCPDCTTDFLAMTRELPEGHHISEEAYADLRKKAKMADVKAAEDAMDDAAAKTEYSYPKVSTEVDTEVKTRVDTSGRSCYNCIDSTPTGKPVPLSANCVNCRRLGNWKEDPNVKGNR